MSRLTDYLWDNYEDLSEKLSGQFYDLPELRESCSDYLELSKKEQYLFVYDTMKQDFRNHKDIAHCRLVGVGCTKSWYTMLIEPKSLGSDAIVLSDPALDHPRAPVFGEIYLVPPSVIRDLDWTESNGFITNRIRCFVDAVVDETGITKQFYPWLYVHKASYWDTRLDRLRWLPPMKPAQGGRYYNFIKPHQNIKEKAA